MHLLRLEPQEELVPPRSAHSLMASGLGPVYFTDENTRGLGKFPRRGGREDVLYPGHENLPEVPLGTSDLDWMPAIAQRGLVVLTRDRSIRTRPAELRVYWDFGIRSVWLGAKQDLGPHDQLALFLQHEARLKHEIIKRGAGPWALAMSASGVRPLNLRSSARRILPMLTAHDRRHAAASSALLDGARGGSLTPARPPAYGCTYAPETASDQAVRPRRPASADIAEHPDPRPVVHGLVHCPPLGAGRRLYRSRRSRTMKVRLRLCGEAVCSSRPSASSAFTRRVAVV